MGTNLVNGKCYFVPIVETLNELIPQMNGRYVEMIKRTPFTVLMDIEEILQERGVCLML